MENKVEDRKYTEAGLSSTSQNEGKTNSSLFQSIYTSLLTNEINLKGDSEKKSRKINFKGETNQIGEERKGVEEEREGKRRRKTIKETSKQ